MSSASPTVSGNRDAMFIIIIIIIIIIIYVFILNADEFLPGGSGTTVRHNTQITHTTLKQNTAHKTKQTKKDLLHTNNTVEIKLQLQQIQLQLQLI
jgi:predicted metalloprotease